jgi:hypothetical protein
VKAKKRQPKQRVGIPYEVQAKLRAIYYVDLPENGILPETPPTAAGVVQMFNTKRPRTRIKLDTSSAVLVPPPPPAPPPAPRYPSVTVTGSASFCRPPISCFTVSADECLSHGMMSFEDD